MLAISYNGLIPGGWAVSPGRFPAQPPGMANQKVTSESDLMADFVINRRLSVVDPGSGPAYCQERGCDDLATQDLDSYPICDKCWQEDQDAVAAWKARTQAEQAEKEAKEAAKQAKREAEEERYKREQLARINASRRSDDDDDDPRMPGLRPHRAAHKASKPDPGTKEPLFYPLDINLAARKDLTSNAKLVYGYLKYIERLSKLPGGSGIVQPGQAAIAAAVGISQSSVSQAVNLLETKKLIIRRYNGMNRPPKYEIL